jgi:anti-anti-sigma factor
MLEVCTTDNGRPALRGELDLLAVASMEAFLAQLNGGCVAIDMSGVTFFDSTALRTMLVARRRNPQLRIVNPSEAVLKILEITDTVAYLVDGPEI